MNMDVEIRTPESVSRWMPQRAWMRVRSAKLASVRVGRSVHPLQLVWLPGALSDEQALEQIEKTGDRSVVRFAVGPSLKRSLREALEKRGHGYLDSRGHLHLVCPGLFLHVEERVESAARPPADGMGVAAVRTIQALLAEQEPIALTWLSRRAGVSAGQAHRVLMLLEREGLVRASGRGPARRRAILSRTALLDWLVAQPSSRRRDQRLGIFVYARTPQELWGRTTDVLDKAGIAHAWTGSAGAALHGVGATSVPISALRVDPDVRLERVADALGAKTTDRGANVELVHDTGRVGTWLSSLREGSRLADPVRIFLDSTRERRGQDVAAQFREVILGY